MEKPDIPRSLTDVLYWVKLWREVRKLETGKGPTVREALEAYDKVHMPGKNTSLVNSFIEDHIDRNNP